MRYLVTDASGNIVRQGLSIDPSLQIAGGDAVYALAGFTGGTILETDVKISAEGGFEPVGGYSGPLPDGSLSQVAPE